MQQYEFGFFCIWNFVFWKCWFIYENILKKREKKLNETKQLCDYTEAFLAMEPLGSWCFCKTITISYAGKKNVTFFCNLDLTFVHGITFVNVEAGRRLISYRLNGVRGDCIWQTVPSSVVVILTAEQYYSAGQIGESFVYTKTQYFR